MSFAVEYSTSGHNTFGATLIYNGQVIDLSTMLKDNIINMFGGVLSFYWNPSIGNGGKIIYGPYRAVQYLNSEEEAMEYGVDIIRICEDLINPEKVKAEYQNQDDIHYASTDFFTEDAQELLEQKLSDENYELSKPEEYRLVDRYFCFTKNNTLPEMAYLSEGNKEVVVRAKVFRHCPGEIVNLKQKNKIEPIKFEEQTCIEIDSASQFKAHDWANRYRFERLAGWHYENSKLIPKDNIFFYTASVRGKILTVGKVMVCFAKMDEETDLLIFLQNLSEEDGEVYRFLFLIEPGSDAWDEIIGNENQVIDEQRIVGWEYNSNSGNLER